MNTGKLALFDFDGTITRKDSLAEFVIFTKGRWNYYAGLFALAPVLVLFKTGLIPNWRAKEKLLSYFFKGMPIDEFQNECNEFVARRLPEIIRVRALEKIDDYLKSGFRIIVVSASPENWVKVWTDSRKMECIATRLEVSERKLTGKIAGKNCHGVEKVDRICKLVDISAFSDVHTYGDSRGDQAMLDLGKRRFYKPFRSSK